MHTALDLGRTASPRPATRVARQAGKIISGLSAAGLGCLRPPGVSRAEGYAAIERAWGATYQITPDGGWCWARRLDGTGVPLPARTPAQLTAAILADQAREQATRTAWAERWSSARRPAVPDREEWPAWSPR